jgi:UDP-N-acetylmuramate: L-alanyl-gamma-D-glutamyl-meso-diaminopimelate ligase
VIEGDEYDTAYFDKVPKFIHYKPQRVILTSVEFDHADIYADFSAVKSAFIKLMELIPQNGVLTYWGDNSDVSEVADRCQAEKKYSYGFNSNNSFRVEINEENAEGTDFSIFFRSQKIGQFKSALSGRYNVLNATAVVAQSYLSDWSMQKITEALESFQGVKRRQDVLGLFDGVTIIEDFAHHPTAVRETVQAIQDKYIGRKVYSVFEPRSATSRRKVFQKDYREAFSQSQEIILAEAFDQGKISEESRFSSAELAEDLRRIGRKAQVFSDVGAIVDYLLKQTVSGDIILIMSNGGFDGIYEKLIQGLKWRGLNRS